jgi:hypothetical protein
MIEGGFFAVERGKDMFIFRSPRLRLTFGSTAFSRLFFLLVLLGGELSQQAFDDFFGRARVGGEGKVRDDHGIFFDTGLFSFAPTGFGRRRLLGRCPVLFQNPHPLTIGADGDMTAFG